MLRSDQIPMVYLAFLKKHVLFNEKPVLEGARRTADPQRPELKKPGKTCVKLTCGAENLEKPL